MDKRSLLRRIPLSLGVFALGVLLWAWRSDTASAIERVWVFCAAVSAAAATWGWSEARRTKGWVGDEAHAHPNLNYASSLIVAQTHLVVHVILWLVQAALLQFGAFSAFTAPVNAGRPITPVAANLTLTLIAVELLLTGLNFWLVWRRAVLVRRVSAIGGD